MNPFDDVFVKMSSLIKDRGVSLDYLKANELPDDKNCIIFQNELAYSLGNDSNYGLGAYAITTDKNKISKDEVILIGKDLPEIKGDCNFARISLILVDDSTDNLFSKVRKIDYVRYHITKNGYMIRISPTLEKESVRVSKSLIKNKISFASIGREYIKKYHELSNVIYSKIIFVTDDNFDYDSLSKYIIDEENITKALDHLANKVNMDCNSCNLQKICASVEELCDELKK